MSNSSRSTYLFYCRLLKNSRTFEVDLTKIESKISRTARSKINSSKEISKNKGFSPYPSVMGIPKPQNTLDKITYKHEIENDA